MPVRIGKKALVSAPQEPQTVRGKIAPPPRRGLDNATKYHAYDPRNWKPGFIFALLGYAGDGLYGQAFASAHDTLRNHTVFLSLLAQGSFELTDGSIYYFNQKHRTSWGGGLFQNLNFRVNPDVGPPEPGAAPCPLLRSAERYYGGSAIVRYPFDRFVFLQGTQSVGAADYFSLGVAGCPADLPFDDPRFQTETTLSFGYSTLRYNAFTGPIGGNSLLLSSTLGLQPFDDEVFGTVRVDGQRYFQISGRWNVAVRAGAGRSMGADGIATQFFLSSFDTLRGVDYGDPNFLYGRNFLYSTAELQFPLDFLVRVAFIDLEGVAGFDFGGVGETIPDVWDGRVLDFATGINFGIGYFILRLHWAKLINIGAPLPNLGDWKTNFSLAYRYW